MTGAPTLFAFCLILGCTTIRLCSRSGFPSYLLGNTKNVLHRHSVESTGIREDFGRPTDGRGVVHDPRTSALCLRTPRFILLIRVSLILKVNIASLTRTG
ncbi:hypothetical protein PF005_g21797 [Phytophthora fragariae]|uniref:RxLR effector protein n=1 Tax=Phytophthora fragariae TaxID=53985 RepID=A0A6A3DZM7_9STRA|nr:hypothetical protein PF003_g9054 [Phytophthora fragariae]KAE8927122.1 hypothetical protein PF009_g22707 [Phytophthora fragariae]KAE8985196.1 hypothetical protein PF011_g20484 [Phytophthora fragariae]KAE9083627.1 hypothetical protein PF007_g21826 [Phytophthora fragariae]KAE9083685.1 hypothetical protein PF010_g21120 [Phytophthora fragariae]